jgi:PKD repeat protein
VLTAETPSAQFSGAPTTGFAPLTVTFTDQSTGAIVTRFWDFGDGMTLSTALTSLTHTYATAGTYSVTLIVADLLRADTNTKPGYIVVRGAPYHSADYRDPRWLIDTSEVSRVLGYWRAGAHRCEPSGLDGYAAGAGDTNCPRHSADYRTASWQLDTTEASRVLGYWRAGCYETNAEGLDGFAAGCATNNGGSVMAAASGPTGAAGGAVAISHTSSCYTAGATLTVSNEFGYSGDLISLVWLPQLPTGWTLLGASGDGTPEVGGGAILFTGSLTDHNPIRMAYTVSVPAGESGTEQLRGEVEYQFIDDVNPTTAFAQPDPLAVASCAAYPPGDVSGDQHVTGGDSLLINQALVGLRATNDAAFQVAGFANGDVNQTNDVSGADSLLINQVLQSRRAYVVTRIEPASGTNAAPTPVIIYGIGFPTNGVDEVNIGPPVDVVLSNVVVLSAERIEALVPAGGQPGTGLVNVVSASSSNVISFARFMSQ